MATCTDIPLDLTDDFKALLFQRLDAQLNSGILYALLYGLYTGIFAVTLRSIFIKKLECRPIRRAVVVAIILLHALMTIHFVANWSWICVAFIKNRQSFWTVYVTLEGRSPEAAYWVLCITSSIGTILADLYMIWCCWMVWGKCWLVVLLPVFSLVSAIVSRIVEEYYGYINAPKPVTISTMLYLSCILATTLSCTLLIIYRIAVVAGVRHGAVGRLGVYRCFIEVLVESSALYSIPLILVLAFIICNDLRLYYFDIIAVIAKVHP
ncbi:hypothetical protein ARMGADRAFT_60214 [Armillaria gallica]|uniref:G-protein coupled receptors family 1 profile domain-containing protein n=1 Tax=Armillaria gallica TaxID=47427 RepID=A0A2H3DLA4_ARMGA|nr:hypothetical protein ARMGADRAFT_60214 [Armillaria gallica]